MHGDIEVARSHCLAMRALIIHHLGGRENGEALGTRNCYVQAVARKEESKIARDILAAGGGHGKEDYRGLLPLEPINCADAHTRW